MGFSTMQGMRCDTWPGVCTVLISFYSRASPWVSVAGPLPAEATRGPARARGRRQLCQPATLGKLLEGSCFYMQQRKLGWVERLSLHKNECLPPSSLPPGPDFICQTLVEPSSVCLSRAASLLSKDPAKGPSLGILSPQSAALPFHSKWS